MVEVKVFKGESIETLGEELKKFIANDKTVISCSQSSCVTKTFNNTTPGLVAADQVMHFIILLYKLH